MRLRQQQKGQLRRVLRLPRSRQKMLPDYANNAAKPPPFWFVNPVWGGSPPRLLIAAAIAFIWSIIVMLNAHEPGCPTAPGQPAPSEIIAQSGDPV